MTSADLHAYLGYRDARAALDWLTAVGFEVVARQDGDAGSVQHAEIRLGDAVVMLATADDDYLTAPLRGRSTGSGLYLWMPDPMAVDDWFHRAISAGGRQVFPPRTPSGEPAGHASSTPRARNGAPAPTGPAAAGDSENHQQTAATAKPSKRRS